MLTTVTVKILMIYSILFEILYENRHFFFMCAYMYAGHF